MCTMPDDVLASAADTRLGPLLLAPAPAWIFAADGRRVLWANAAGVAFFGERSLGGLKDRRFRSDAPSARQIEALARNLALDGEPRLALLRLSAGPAPRPVSGSCCKIRFGDADAVLVAAGTPNGAVPTDLLRHTAERLLPDTAAAFLGADGNSRWQSASWQADMEPQVAARLLPDLLQEAREQGRAARSALGVRVELARIAGPETLYLAVAHRAEPNAGADAAVPASAAEAAEAVRIEPPSDRSQPGSGRPVEPVGRPKTLRFTWRMDRSLRFTAVSSEFGDAVGGNAAIVGRSWTEVAARFGLDPDGTVARRLGRREAWTAADMDWPAEDGSAVPIEFAGLPVFDAEQEFQGFRGFGICRLDRVMPAASFRAATPRNEARSEPDAEPVERFDASEPPADVPAAIETALPEAAAQPGNVVPLRADRSRVPAASAPLAQHEHDAFREIARALGAKLTAEPYRESPVEEDRAETGDAESVPTGAPATHRSGERPAAGSAGGAAPVGVEGQLPVRLADEPDGREAGSSDRRDPRPAPSPGAPEAPRPSGEPRTGFESVLLDRLPLGVLVLRDGRVIYANRRVLTLFGYTTADAVDAAGGMAALFADATPAPPGDGEARPVRARKADGAPVDVEARLFGVDLGGAPGLLLTVEPAERAEPIDGADAWAGDMLDSVPDGLVAVGGNGHVERVNASLRELLGRSESELLNRPFPNLFTGESRFAVLEALNRALRRGGASETADAELWGAKGRMPVRLWIRRIGPESGRLGVVVRDAGDLLRASTDAADAQRRADAARRRGAELLESVSHGIRGPLNAIVGFAELMAGQRFGPLGNERYAACAADIRASGRDLEALLDDVVRLAQIESGAAQLAFRPVSINQLVEQSVREMQGEAQRGRAIMRTSLSAAVPSARADEPSLRRMLVHLLAQAIEWARNGGQVIVSTVVGENGRAVLRIRGARAAGERNRAAQGAAQPAELHATSPFDRDVGAALTEAVVEAHRGTLHRENRTGSGLLIEVSLPVAKI